MSRSCSGVARTSPGTTGSAPIATVDGGPAQKGPGLGVEGPELWPLAEGPCVLQTCTMLLCLVMDCSEGSFQDVIEKKREEKAIIDSEVRQAL